MTHTHDAYKTGMSEVLHLFDVGVFSSLDESSPWPILDLRGLVYRLDAAGAEVRLAAAGGSSRT